MSNKLESWTRLRGAPWIGKVDPKRNDPTCTFQVLSNGHGDYIYDEYSVVITSMPANLTAEDYLSEFARDPNAAVDKTVFNVINVFKKRVKSAPAIGDIYDIDILGPEGGSIVVVAVSPGFGTSSGDSWFDIQTVQCKRYGWHPENGAREFGFQYVSGGVMFYTRGVSRGHFAGVQTMGSIPQNVGWTAMMKGISETIRRRGGQPKDNSFKQEKVARNL